MNVIPGEQLVLIGDAAEIPLPPQFKGATITGFFQDPGELRTMFVLLNGTHALQVGVMEAERPQEGKPYRMGIRLADILPGAEDPPQLPSDAKIKAVVGGRTLDRISVDRSGGGIQLELSGGLVLQINATGIALGQVIEKPKEPVQ